MQKNKSRSTTHRQDEPRPLKAAPTNAPCEKSTATKRWLNRFVRPICFFFLNLLGLRFQKISFVEIEGDETKEIFYEVLVRK